MTDLSIYTVYIHYTDSVSAVGVIVNTQSLDVLKVLQEEDTGGTPSPTNCLLMLRCDIARTLRPSFLQT